MTPEEGKPLTLEGNLAAIDLASKFITLQLRDGSEVKILYKPAQEPTIQKQKIGYYEKPAVIPTAAPKEYTLEDLPYTARPADFPRLQRQQSGSGGYHGGSRPYQQPRNEKAIMYECALKVAAEVYIGRLGGNSAGVNYETAMESIISAAVKATEAGCKVAEVP
jgi:hypothetical protein